MTPSASEQIAPAVSKNTTIVVIQNGVGNADQFRERFPENVVLSAVVSSTLSLIGKGVQTFKTYVIIIPDLG